MNASAESDADPDRPVAGCAPVSEYFWLLKRHRLPPCADAAMEPARGEVASWVQAPRPRTSAPMRKDERFADRFTRAPLRGLWTHIDPAALLMKHVPGREVAWLEV